jgi:hypothetical protein
MSSTSRSLSPLSGGDRDDQIAFDWLSRFFGPAMLARAEEFRNHYAKVQADFARRAGADEESAG